MTPAPKILLETAVTEYLRKYEAEHSANSISITRSHIKRFACAMVLTRPYLHALTRYDLNRYLGQWEGLPRRLRATAVRSFMRWASEQYGLTLPVPDHAPVAPSPLAALRIHDEAGQRWRQARATAARMWLSHQRAIFLCGFLHLLPMVRVHKATLVELQSLPQRPDFYALLAQVVSGGGAAQGPFFLPWLGQHLKTAEKRWREWAGGVQFRRIVEAGNDARWRLGLRPHREWQYDAHAGLMPVVDSETIRRLPEFWEEL